jgi:hypothetical protein
MARPVSWHHRFHEIRNRVTNSQRSHYDRPGLEDLFNIQSTAAGKLLQEILPTQAVGQAHLVTREDLLRFLNLVDEAGDVAAARAQMQAEKLHVSHRKLRNLTSTDLEPLPVASLPDWIHLSRGRVEIRFDSVTQFFEGLILLIRTVLSLAGMDEFCELYEPEQPLDPELEAEHADFREIRRQIEELRAIRDPKSYEAWKVRNGMGRPNA